MFRIFLAEGYLEEESKISTRLFICENKNQLIAKTNISNSLNRNHSILLDDIERLNEEDKFDEIYLVGETFFEIDQDTLEELKLKCSEIWTMEEENFTQDKILKNLCK